MTKLFVSNRVSYNIDPKFEENKKNGAGGVREGKGGI